MRAGHVVIGGVANLADETQAWRRETLRRLFETLEREQEMLQRAAGRRPADDVSVTIGEEHPTTGEWEASIVTAPFQAGEATVGTIGIVGPTRMDYLSAMASVRAVAERLSEARDEPTSSMAPVRDLYEILGVGRDACDDDIRTAYRRLARELHPDVNGDPAAEERFKEIAGAYEILSDPEKRARYDAFGNVSGPGGQPFADISDIFEMFFGQARWVRRLRAAPRPARTRAPRARTSRVRLRLTFGEAAFGVATRRRARTARRCASRCLGNGAKPGTAPIACRTCGGTGEVQSVRRSVFGTLMTTVAVRRRAEGTGQEIPDPCETCGGAGPGRGNAPTVARRDPGRRVRRDGAARRRERATPASRAGPRATCSSGSRSSRPERSSDAGRTCTRCSTSRSRRRRSAPRSSGSPGSTATRRPRRGRHGIGHGRSAEGQGRPEPAPTWPGRPVRDRSTS